MKKVLLVGMLIAAPIAIHADWLDDLVTSYNESGSFDKDKALNIIGQYQEKDEQKRNELEKNVEKADSKGFWGGVREGSYKAELTLLRNEIDYYKKIARTIREFPENKKQQEAFTRALKKLSRAKDRLASLRDRYRKGSGIFDKVRLGTVIAAKEVQIVARRTYIKNILL